MSCLTPLTLYHSEDGSYTFNINIGYNPFSIPCGQCLGCRIDNSRDWALRCMHHSKQYSNSCFITLTFDDQHLAGRKSVRVSDFQLFMKRFRDKLKREDRPSVQYFHSTEYGDKHSRPHHHAILFNYFPPDAVVREKVGDNLYYTSQELSDLWNNQGFIIVGALSYQSAAYTAAYTFKKMKGKDYPDGVSPEKMTCSQGIGISHFLTYYKEYCRLGYIIHDDKKFRIPRAYLKKLDVSVDDIIKAVDSGNYALADDLRDRRQFLSDLKFEREMKSREDSILDRERKYRHLIDIQTKYKKKLCNDTPLSDDNRYLKQLRSLQLQIMRISGEYNPSKMERIYESIRSL